MPQEHVTVAKLQHKNVNSQERGGSTIVCRPLISRQSS